MLSNIRAVACGVSRSSIARSGAALQHVFKSGANCIESSTEARNSLGTSSMGFSTLAKDSAEPPWSKFMVPEGFELKGGEKMDTGFLVFQTHGQLNADRSNAILHPTSFDATHWELEFNIGPGKMLDSSKYFIIVVNLMGNGVSFSPSNSKDFPRCGVTICDNVRMQSLLVDSLGISKLHLIYGYSMGAMQALHWGVMYPTRVLRIASVCGAARPSDYNKVFLDSLEAALLADPDCKEDADGHLTRLGPCARGLKAFARIYAGWGVSPEFYRRELWRTTSRDGKRFANCEDFVVRSYEGGFANADPLNLLAQIRAWRLGDVSKAHSLPHGSSLQEALKKISARVYVMPCTTDRYFIASEVQEEAAMISNSVFAPIESDWGHRAGDTHRPGQEQDALFLQAKVEELLSE